MQLGIEHAVILLYPCDVTSHAHILWYVRHIRNLIGMCVIFPYTYLPYTHAYHDHTPPTLTHTPPPTLTLQQRANKLKEVRVMREVQQRKEYEKKMEHERMLEAKPAK